MGGRGANQISISISEGSRMIQIKRMSIDEFGG